MSRSKIKEDGRLKFFVLLNSLYLFLRTDSPAQRKQRRVLKRLFRYSRPDWPLITCGTILLLGAALCKYYRL